MANLHGHAAGNGGHSQGEPTGTAPALDPTVDSGRTPQGIRRGHFPDKGGDLGIDGRAASVDRPESPAQYSRKRRRCHRRTVSGDTMTRACLQPVQTLASPTQKRRSIRRSFGRGAVRL